MSKHTRTHKLVRVADHLHRLFAKFATWLIHIPCIKVKLINDSHLTIQTETNGITSPLTSWSEFGSETLKKYLIGKKDKQSVLNMNKSPI